LDPQIRDYVFVPMIIVVFMFGLVRHYLTKLISSPAEGNETQKLLKAVELHDYEQLPKTEALLAEADKDTMYR
jgi:hypothetical protein